MSDGDASAPMSALLRGLPAPGEVPGAVSLTIGSFDGVHRGHRALVRTVAADAAAQGGAAVVITFDPHPRCVLDPPSCPPLLTSVAERALLLGEQGAAVVCVLPFTPEVSRWSAGDFCDRLLGAFRVRLLVTGPGFALGRNREGSLDFLREYARTRRFELRTVAPVMWDGTPVSSSRVRAALGAGRVGAARRLLGRSYALRGRVERGDQRGRTLGFPTANLAVRPGRCVPAPGVYATWLDTAAGRLPAATSVGFRPTFGGDHLTVEAHALDFDGDLYGQEVTLSFVSRLRGERRFASAAALVARMGHDVAVVRARLAREEERERGR